MELHSIGFKPLVEERDMDLVGRESKRHSCLLLLHSHSFLLCLSFLFSHFVLRSFSFFPFMPSRFSRSQQKNSLRKVDEEEVKGRREDVREWRRDFSWARDRADTCTARPDTRRHSRLKIQMRKQSPSGISLTWPEKRERDGRLRMAKLTLLR